MRWRDLQGMLRGTYSIACLLWCWPRLGYADGLTIGDDTTYLRIGGAIRERYDYLYDATPVRDKSSFDTARLDLTYTSPTLIGYAQYRDYDFYGRLGDVNFPIDAWLGYKLGPTAQVQVGLNPIPFGLGTTWGTDFFLGIADALGLEDVHNVGIKLGQKSGPVDVQIGYYLRDGGRWTGRSTDAARYTVNLVNADPSLPKGSNNTERNMLVGRASYALADGDALAQQVGASFWVSQIHNTDTGQNGQRLAWAVFSKTRWTQWGLLLQAAGLDIRAKNPASDAEVTVGGFDGSFNVAAKGNVYLAELNYSVGNLGSYIKGVTLYANYSTYIKSVASFNNSSRLVSGTTFSIHKISVSAEMLVGKHDTYVSPGEYQDGLGAGAGPDRWDRHFFVNVGYYF